MDASEPSLQRVYQLHIHCTYAYTQSSDADLALSHVLLQQITQTPYKRLQKGKHIYICTYVYTNMKQYRETNLIVMKH